MPKREIEGEAIEQLEGLSVQEFGKSYPAWIVRLVKTTAGEIFRNKDGEFVGKVGERESPEQAEARPTLLIQYEGAGFAGEAVLNIPEVARPNSKMGKFAKRYGGLPSKGMEVSVHLSQEGEYTRAELDL